MMNKSIPLDDQVDLVSDDDVDMEVDSGPSVQQLLSEAQISQPAIVNSSEGSIVRKAKMYQEYMKKVPIPKHRGSIILCNSWVGLAKSMKGIYGQPLHYLTNILLKQWDQARLETGDEYQPLDTVIQPLKAESTIWFIEEVHRLTASYHQLSKLWLRDPMYYAFIDPVVPTL